jgi:hypothetical protein
MIKKFGVILGLIIMCLLLWSMASYAGIGTSPKPSGIGTSPITVTMPPAITGINIPSKCNSGGHYLPYWTLWPPVSGLNTADVASTDDISTSPTVVDSPGRNGNRKMTQRGNVKLTHPRVALLGMGGGRRESVGRPEPPTHRASRFFVFLGLSTCIY